MHERPPCVKGAAERSEAGGLLCAVVHNPSVILPKIGDMTREPYNPSVTAVPCHLPLHRGGFDASSNKKSRAGWHAIFVFL